MRFADFVKKHFPLNHPTAVKPKVKQKRRETISGFRTGDRVSLTGYNDRLQGVVTRVAGRRITVRWSINDSSWSASYTDSYPLVIQ